jgi:hypothetical protein
MLDYSTVVLARIVHVQYMMTVLVHKCTGKKIGALRMTTRKLQGVYLELSLRQASGWTCGGNSAIGSGDQQQQQQQHDDAES